MKTYISLILISLVVVIVFAACSGETIDIASVSSFRHEVSANIPFDPMEDPSARLYVDNEGRAVFIKPNEKHPGTVNAEKEYCPEIFVVDKNGVHDTLQPGIFKAWGESREGKYLIGVGGKYSIHFIDKATLKTTEVMDDSLVSILRGIQADCVSDKAVLYSVPQSSILGIYDIQTENEVIFDLKEDYVSIDGIDFDGDSILVKAVKNRDEPPDLYILGLDGTVELKLSLDWSQITQYCNACSTHV